MTKERPALIAAVAFVLVVVTGLGLWSPSDPFRSTLLEGGSDTAACVAPAGAEGPDVDSDDSPEARGPHTRGERVVVRFAVRGLPARYANLVVIYG
jgi:hypothetical protein